MDGKLRNMTSVYITNKSKDKMLLYRQGGRGIFLAIKMEWCILFQGRFRKSRKSYYDN